MITTGKTKDVPSIVGTLKTLVGAFDAAKDAGGADTGYDDAKNACNSLRAAIKTVSQTITDINNWVEMVDLGQRMTDLFLGD